MEGARRMSVGRWLADQAIDALRVWALMLLSLPFLAVLAAFFGLIGALVWLVLLVVGMCFLPSERERRRKRERIQAEIDQVR